MILALAAGTQLTRWLPFWLFPENKEPPAVVAYLLTLYLNRELCKEYGKNGRQFVLNNLTREVGTQKYVDVIKSVVKD